MIIGSIVFDTTPERATTMIPRLTIGTIILIVVIYWVGAHWPGMAQKYLGA